MTLGEFRQITKQYDDDCELSWCKDAANPFSTSRVRMVRIDIRETDSDDPFSLTPEIIVL